MYIIFSALSFFFCVYTVSFNPRTCRRALLSARAGASEAESARPT